MAKAEWTDIAQLETSSGLKWKPPLLRRCDPYLVWSDLTTYPRTVVDDAQDNKLALQTTIGVLVELPRASDLDAFVTAMNGNAGSPDDLHFMPAGFEGLQHTRFVTGFVSRTGLRRLVHAVADGTACRFTLQESRRTPHRRAANDLMDRDGSTAVPYTESDSSEDSSATGTFLGIVDDGLPLDRVHGAITRAGGSAHFWDQGWRRPGMRSGAGVQPGSPPDDDPFWRPAWDFWLNPVLPGLGPLITARGFFYGRRLKAVPPSQPAMSSGGGTLYASRGYFTPVPRRSHGAAVLGLMAPWIAAANGATRWPSHISALAMVQLPTATVEDTSGGSLAARVLDGLRYVLWQEETSRPGKDAQARPVVVNASYGVHAGPHDGTSMFERALLEMLDDHPHLHVVLPAGNAARAGCHARRTLEPLGRGGDCATLKLQVPPDHRHDSFVEFWMPAGAEIELTIQPPGSRQAHAIRLGEARAMVYREARTGGETLSLAFAAVYPAESALGTAGRMLLLAIGATRRLPPERWGDILGPNRLPRRAVAAPSGLWTLQIHNRGAQATVVDAWVERSDAPPDHDVGSRQAFFPDSCNEQLRQGNATPEGTLNGIATAVHPQLHVIGAMRLDGTLSAYSAAGPARVATGRHAPDDVAPADASRALPGLRSIGLTDGAVERINGTSAACAVYTRALALQLATCPAGRPTAPLPPDIPSEIDCTPESQPLAAPAARGHGVRGAFPHELEPVAPDAIPRPTHRPAPR